MYGGSYYSVCVKVRNKNQKELLNEICKDVRKENITIDTKLDKDSLYAADSSYLSKSNIAVIPRIQCSIMAQSVFFLYISLGHMFKASMIYIANDGSGEKGMITNWPIELLKMLFRKTILSVNPVSRHNLERLHFQDLLPV